ncbi:MAG: ribosome recycling factor [Planctomycetota bacterium]|jgi:ribosome recycling factor|nr:ribosome recycling factor [Planctomycetota bacterium]MDP6762621.1 ribosome recycling factor [Planctomycetota bacterium]
MSFDGIKKDAKGRMEKAVTHLQDVLRSVRTSQASPALVENIRVDYYGTPTPISQLGAVSIPEPRQIAIKPFDPSILQEVQKAILKSDLGINPQSDGKVLRLTLPQLSGEQRTKYAARVKELCEEGRIAMRNIRRELNKTADQARKDSELTEDENKKLHDEIQKLLKTYEEQVDGVQDKKVCEIMEV